MAYWLMKSEPDAYGWHDLLNEPTGVGRWDGVRNYQARNNLRAMKKGDKAFFYHSVVKPTCVAGTMEIVKGAYPDPLQFDEQSPYCDPKSPPDDPRWDCVEVAALEAFDPPVTVGDLKAIPDLANMVLFQNTRLSIQPVTAAEWRIITGLRKRRKK